MQPSGVRALSFIAAVLGMATVGSSRAQAAGFYLLEAELKAGVSEGPLAEGGMGLSLYSNELAAWVTIGDASQTGGRRVKEWWLESRSLGPVMGTLPSSMQAAGFAESERVGRENLWIPFRTWAFGADYTTGRWLQWDYSHHLLCNLASFTRVSHRSLLFGPTLGLGVRLDWWEGWRGNDTQLINTGKITVEGGWIAGVSLGDFSYAQARVHTWLDVFGVHQRQIRFAGVLGLTGIQRDVPLGLELQWELERGDDTVDIRPAATHTVMLAATWRMMPKTSLLDADAFLEALQGSKDDPARDRSEPLPPPEPEDDELPRGPSL